MSAIAGIVSSDESLGEPSVLTTRLDTLLGAMAHRGGGLARSEHVSHEDVRGILGASVSQFTPESAAECQPLVDQGSGCVLVWDGRLDNREELTSELAASSDAADADLVLRAYLRWGQESPAKLAGDYAFAVWDARDRSLYAARDPLGMKPFFYSQSAAAFLFANEIQALLRLPEAQKGLDEEMVSEFLVWWSDFPQIHNTFYSAIRRLPPGHWLRWKSARTEVGRHWEMDPERRIVHPRYEDYVGEFESVFRRAVAARMRARGRVGVFLSGGLDSSAVASMASRYTGPDVSLHAYCMHLTDPRDESGYAEQVARRAGIPFRKTPILTESCLEGLEARVVQQAMPFVDRGWNQDLKILRIAAGDGVRVVLTGDGFDEVTCFPLDYMLGVIGRLRLRKLVREVLPSSKYYAPSFFESVLMYPRLLAPRFVQKIWKQIKRRRPPAWINPDFARRTDLLRRLRSTFRSPRQTHAYYMLTRGRVVLHREEREISAMRTGIELRSPFYDRRIVEFMLAVPWDVQVSTGQAKSFLRDIPGLLPDSLRALQSKADYSYVHENLLRKNDAPALRELFREPPAAAAAYVQFPVARQICEAFLAGNNDYETLTRFLACFFLWLRNSPCEAVGIPARERVLSREPSEIPL